MGVYSLGTIFILTVLWFSVAAAPLRDDQTIATGSSLAGPSQSESGTEMLDQFVQFLENPKGLPLSSFSKQRKELKNQIIAATPAENRADMKAALVSVISKFTIMNKLKTGDPHSLQTNEKYNRAKLLFDNDVQYCKRLVQNDAPCATRSSQAGSGYFGSSPSYQQNSFGTNSATRLWNTETSGTRSSQAGPTSAKRPRIATYQQNSFGTNFVDEYANLHAYQSPPDYLEPSNGINTTAYQQNSFGTNSVDEYANLPSAKRPRIAIPSKSVKDLVNEYIELLGTPDGINPNELPQHRMEKQNEIVTLIPNQLKTDTGENLKADMETNLSKLESNFEHIERITFGIPKHVYESQPDYLAAKNEFQAVVRHCWALASEVDEIKKITIQDELLSDWIE